MHLLRFFTSTGARSVKPAPHHVVIRRHKAPGVGVVNARALTFIGCMMALPMPALGSDLQPTEADAPAVKAPAPTQRGLAMGARMVLVELVTKDTGSNSVGGVGVAGEALVFATSSLAFGAQVGTMAVNLNSSNEYCHTCTGAATWAVALGELRAPIATYTPYIRFGGGYGHSAEAWDSEEHDHFAMQVEGGLDFHARGGFSLRALVQLFVLPGAEDFPAVGAGLQLGFEPSL